MIATVAECVAQQKRLAAISDSPRLDCELLLAEVLGKSRSWLFAYPEKALEPEQLCAFESLFERRLNGEPIAHILGRREFWGLTLAVNASTLIPRPDTETLVEAALELSLASNAAVLDLGTGTGAIALALAHERPTWQLVGADFSEEAVALAEHNAQLTGLTGVSFHHSNWYAAFAGQRFDLIVSNPPYIDKKDQHLNEGDVRFEPLSALVAEQQGLADLAYIISQAPSYLESAGFLMLEHGYDQGAAVRKLLEQHGFVAAKTIQDLGGNDRVSFVQLGK